ncbi:Tigger transposable element-derived protein 6 [Trichinella pseudospiralis]|uniref:Tigger transposable element-derived protein 6 n=1 Tax=Trichinella pseudospiralis TaxID=6337 RepID=A0A0V1FUQ5_TRIPS|nr:Tigger transposable element-derived protein 6 [Trichinella pseudospiralis]
MKRTRITIGEKREIIELLKQNYSASDIAQRYQISRSTVFLIQRNSQRLLNPCLQESLFAIRPGKYALVEAVLEEWLVKERALNHTISGSVIQYEALQIANQLNLHNFKASTGWLSRFKNRLCLNHYRWLSKERLLPGVIEEWQKNVLDVVCAKYQPDDIFAADQIELYFRREGENKFYCGVLFDNIENTCEKISILLAVCMSGSCKIAPVIVSSAEDEEVECKSSSAFQYCYQENGDITEGVFKEWLKSMDEWFLSRGRRICLLMSDIFSYAHDLSLNAVEIIFCPRSARYYLHPCYQGIFDVLIANFAKLHAKHLYEVKQYDKDFIDTETQINFIIEAMSGIDSEILLHAFRRCGFYFAGENASTSESRVKLNWLKVFEENLFNNLELSWAERCRMDNILASDLFCNDQGNKDFDQSTTSGKESSDVGTVSSTSHDQIFGSFEMHWDGEEAMNVEDEEDEEDEEEYMEIGIHTFINHEQFGKGNQDENNENKDCSGDQECENETQYVFDDYDEEQEEDDDENGHCPESKSHRSDNIEQIPKSTLAAIKRLLVYDTHDDAENEGTPPRKRFTLPTVTRAFSIIRDFLQLHYGEENVAAVENLNSALEEFMLNDC